MGERSVGKSRGYLVSRLYTHTHAVASSRRVVVVVASSSSLPLAHARLTRRPSIPLFFFLFRLLARESALWLGLVSHARLVGRLDRNIGRFGLFLPVYTYSYSRSTWPTKGGEPDLSPLNGINKLYYACTSPWNTIPAGVLVRTNREGKGGGEGEALCLQG